MKVYLAARYERQLDMRLYRDRLRTKGVEVTSRWIDNPAKEGETPHNRPKEALEDVQDVCAADTLIFFSETNGAPRGGRHVEFGIAVARGITIKVVGGHENIFHYLPRIEHYETFEELLRYV